MWPIHGPVRHPAAPHIVVRNWAVPVKPQVMEFPTDERSLQALARQHCPVVSLSEVTPQMHRRDKYGNSGCGPAPMLSPCQMFRGAEKVREAAREAVLLLCGRIPFVGHFVHRTAALLMAFDPRLGVADLLRLKTEVPQSMAAPMARLEDALALARGQPSSAAAAAAAWAVAGARMSARLGSKRRPDSVVRGAGIHGHVSVKMHRELTGMLAAAPRMTFRSAVAALEAVQSGACLSWKSWPHAELTDELRGTKSSASAASDFGAPKHTLSRLR